MSSPLRRGFGAESPGFGGRRCRVRLRRWSPSRAAGSAARSGWCSGRAGACGTTAAASSPSTPASSSTRRCVRWPDPPVRPAPPSTLLDRAARGPVVLADLSVAAVRPRLGAPRRRRPRAGVRRAARRRARQPARLPADDVRRRGDRRRRPALDDAGLPRPQPRRPRAGAGRAGRGRRRRRPLRDRRRPRARACGRASPRCSTSTASGWPRSPPAMGLPVAVPESPEAPPVDLRPARVAEKQRAGAQLCVLNHVSSPARVAEFVAAARAAGATLPFVAGGRRLHRRAARRGCCSASPACTWTTTSSSGCSPRRTRATAGIAAAVEEARALLASRASSGVNLSGMGSSRGEDDGARSRPRSPNRLRGTA